MAVGIRLHFCREGLRGPDIFFERTGELRCLCLFQLSLAVVSGRCYRQLSFRLCRLATEHESMNEQELFILLQQVKNGRVNPEQALKKIRLPPVEVLDAARLDHHRILRTGLPEAVFGENKTVDQLVEILRAMLKRPTVVLATRVDQSKAEQVCARVKGMRYHKTSRLLTGNKEYIPENVGRGTVVVVTAGTSDMPVAEEARCCLKYFGHEVDTLYDAGVAGIHRILAHGERLQQASVLIVVAGMEGALPSVVAGMTPAPVIAVPSSIGYGTGAGGFSALLGMLNSCASGMAVVNIDNGFGAACMAAAINRKRFQPALAEHFSPPTG